MRIWLSPQGFRNVESENNLWFLNTFLVQNFKVLYQREMSYLFWWVSEFLRVFWSHFGHNIFLLGYIKLEDCIFYGSVELLTLVLDINLNLIPSAEG